MQQDIRPVYMFYPGLYPLLMLNYWIRRSDVPIVGIIISDFDLKHKGKILSFFEVVVGMIQYAGWRYTLFMLMTAKFSVPLVSFWNFLRRLFKKEVKIKTFDEIIKAHNIPMRRSKDFNSRECRTFIKSVNANLIISVYNNQIIKVPTYQSVEFGAINIHPAMLPDFRGLDGPFQAMSHGLKEYGATIHRVDSEIDTGNILAQASLKVRKNDSLFFLSFRTWMQGAKLLEYVLDQFKKGTIKEIDQAALSAAFPYESFPSKEQVKKFRKQENRFFRWRDLRASLRVLRSPEIGFLMG